MIKNFRKILKRIVFIVGFPIWAIWGFLVGMFIIEEEIDDPFDKSNLDFVYEKYMRHIGIIRWLCE